MAGALQSFNFLTVVVMKALGDVENLFCSSILSSCIRSPFLEGTVEWRLPILESSVKRNLSNEGKNEAAEGTKIPKTRKIAKVACKPRSQSPVILFASELPNVGVHKGVVGSVLFVL
jgi:hypothetical protein